MLGEAASVAGGAGLGGILGQIGDVLSAPRRMAWSALGLPEDGTELVHNLTGMDKDSIWTKALGLGAEVVGDPLTYAGGLLGHGAKAATARRLAPEAAEAGGKFLGPAQRMILDESVTHLPPAPFPFDISPDNVRMPGFLNDLRMEGPTPSNIQMQDKAWSDFLGRQTEYDFARAMRELDLTGEIPAGPGELDRHLLSPEGLVTKKEIANRATELAGEEGFDRLIRLARQHYSGSNPAIIDPDATVARSLMSPVEHSGRDFQRLFDAQNWEVNNLRRRFMPWDSVSGLGHNEGTLADEILKSLDVVPDRYRVARLRPGSAQRILDAAEGEGHYANHLHEELLKNLESGGHQFGWGAEMTPTPMTELDFPRMWGPRLSAEDWDVPMWQSLMHSLRPEDWSRIARMANETMDFSVPNMVRLAKEFKPIHGTLNRELRSALGW